MRKFEIGASLFLIGLFLWHCVQSPNPLREVYFQKPVVVVGKVVGIPKRNKLGSRFLVAIKTINAKKQRGTQRDKLHDSYVMTSTP